ncbi:hypothetical protein M407DRAFT_24317 [Tulasnella calospora MUT 4182]|uniref:Protein kinase domain-containing protein n=1 Tax=Tulasnella calospora MUT 4182 TaxID=1051891 RepID=A0A0C3LY52_9AGAM|nr:hypothetical protein M407DRAFT_24317 [Tulasnella calospora MUT 4182]
MSQEERLDRLSKYRIPHTAIGEPEKSCGRGGKAEVVQASFRRSEGGLPELVAVKKLLCGDTTDREVFSKEFVHEVEMLARLSHKNIIRLIGFVEDLQHDKAWIALSWEPNGNVRDFLASGKWEIPEHVSLIKDMFEGLKYLHKHKPPICHGDLKSLNILVSSSCRAIITDFGLARLMSSNAEQGENQEGSRDSHAVSIMLDGGCASGTLPKVTIVATNNQLTLTGPVWSLRWAAPELIMEEQQPGLASDIWSAGWVCWEMMTDRVPFDDIKRDCAVMLKVVQGTVPAVHEDEQLTQITALCSLMTDCWKFEPKNRPIVDQCCNAMKWIQTVPPVRGGSVSAATKELAPGVLYRIGYLHYMHGRHAKAALLLEQLIASAGSAVDLDVAHATKALGDVYTAQCKYAKAKEQYTIAQELYARIDDGLGQANTLDGLGELYRAQSKYNDAKESLTRAKEIHVRIGNDLGQANAILGLGDVYRVQRKFPEAGESYTRAEEIFARIGEDLGQVGTLKGLGDIYRMQSKYGAAKESYMRAQEIYARKGSDLGRANTLNGLGHVYRAESMYSEASESYT